MIIQYDKRPNASIDEKLNSLVNSIILAFGESDITSSQTKDSVSKDIDSNTKDIDELNQDVDSIRQGVSSLVGTVADLAEAVRNLQVEAFDGTYPIGCYFETSDVMFNPNVEWGGEWVLESEGQVHVSAGEHYLVLESGSNRTQYYASGSNTSTSMATIPANSGAHSHTYSEDGAVGAVSGATTGNGDNMLPYIIVYRWHRIG